MRSTPSTDDEAKRLLYKATKDQLGAFGERLWSRILASSGWHYVSLTKICEGGAPLARGKKTELILPDLDAYRDGKSVFVECKVKTQSIVYRMKKQERHGINERNYRHYNEIQHVSGKPCCIALVELARESIADQSLSWSGSLLFQKLNDLLDPMSEYQESTKKVYWRRKEFCDLGSFTPRELFALANGEKSINLSFAIEQILFPMKQVALF